MSSSPIAVSSPIPYVPPRQNSVVMETIVPGKKLSETCELVSAEECKSFLYSPSWHPGMLPGENMIIYEPSVGMELTSSVQANYWLSNVAYINNETITPKKNGVLIGTNFRLIFVDNTEKPHIFPKTKRINLIPLNTIGNITFLVTGKDESTSKTLQLWCKDWRLITLTFETPAICADMHKKLVERTVSSIETVFAFAQNIPAPPPKEHIMAKEFKRMGLDPSKWRLTTINEDHSKIPSYPATFIVPNDTTDAVLHKAAAFRCNNRIPAVCWVSPSGVSISRTSQPHTGIWSARSEDDEMLVRGIFSNNEYYSNRTMYIMDCRPKLSAVGNMAKGLGYEKPEGYSEHSCEIMWMGIDNIHAMRDSLRNMYKLCLGSQSDHKWLSNLEYTRWLDHLNLVMASAVKAVELVQQGSSILVHCSDGWDRTPQITSLAQILLSPYYRTVEGFFTLIDKEWRSFGHRFQARSGHGCQDFWTNDHCSPIFLQWVDCVWQVMQQFPHCFEFNEKLLVDILDNLYNCYFLEFLFNNEKEMLQAKPGPSLWKRYLERANVDFINPFYHETNKPQVLLPDSSPKRLKFWAGYYLRYYQPLEEGMHYIHQIGRDLLSENDKLVKRLKQMELELEKEKATRSKLEKQLSTVSNANDKERERRSIEYKVMSEEGEGTVWCKIGIDGMANPPLKRMHIIDDYDPSITNPSSSSSSPYIEIEPSTPPPPSPYSYEMEQALPVSPKRKNSRIIDIEQQPMEEMPA